MKKLLFILATVALMLMPATPALADDVVDLPHAFYGSLTVNGGPAPAGIMVEARGNGVVTGVDGNPTTTVSTGVYGTSNAYEPRLVVQGEISEGTALDFYVSSDGTNLVKANTSTIQWHSGEVTELNLAVALPAVEPDDGDGGGNGGGGVIEPKPGETDVRSYVSSTGRFKSTVRVYSYDKNLTLVIPEGTIGLDANLNPLKVMKIKPVKNLPSSMEDERIIGLPYTLEPSGATFNPAVTLEWEYDPDDIPEGIAEKDLVIAYYDKSAGEWVKLDCTIDTKNNTVTATLKHFTYFAVLGIPPGEEEVIEEEEETVPEEEEVIEEEEETIPEQEEETVEEEEETAPEQEGTIPPAKGTNWGLIGGIAGGVVVIALSIFFVWNRRRSY